MSHAGRHEAVSDVVSGGGVRAAPPRRLSPSTTRAVRDRLHQPGPLPRRAMLAWISDRDGRPRAWVAPLPPDGSPVVEPAWPLPTDGGDDRRRALGRAEAHLVAGRVLAGLPARARRRRAHPRPPGHPGRHRRPRTSPRAPPRSRSAPGRPAGASSASRSSAPAAATAWPASWTCATARRRCSPPGPAAVVCAISGDGMRAVVRVGRRGARRLELFDLRSGRCTELLPGGEATVADARFGITGGQLFVHSDAGGERPALLAVGAQRRRRAVAAAPRRRPRRRRPRPRRAGPGGRPRRAGVERRRPQRGGPARPALRHRRAAALPARRRRHRRRLHPRRRAPCWSATRAPPSRRRSPGSPSTTTTASR